MLFSHYNVATSSLVLVNSLIDEILTRSVIRLIWAQLARLIYVQHAKLIMMQHFRLIYVQHLGLIFIFVILIDLR